MWLEDNGRTYGALTVNILMSAAMIVVSASEGADAGFLKGGFDLGLHAKKGGGPALGQMLKSLHRGPKKGGGGGVRPLPPICSC